MIRLEKIFNITYGNKFDLNKMNQDEGEVNFVGRSVKNNGVTAKVKLIKNVTPYQEGMITVALGGSILTSYLQVKPFYTGQNIAVLTPLEGITLNEVQKLFYCKAIHFNAYRFSAFGREANRTLRTLLVPSLDEIPYWVKDINLNKFCNMIKPKIKKDINLPIINEYTTIGKLFDVVNGINANGLKEEDKFFNGSIMFFRPAKTQSRTLRSFVPKKDIPHSKIFPKESLFVSTNGEGSHTYSYVSSSEFVPNSDVSVLIPRKKMSLELKLYYSKCITKNRYLFSYGRKPKGNKLKNLKIPLVSEDNVKQVEQFIRSLRYSSSI